MIKHILTAAGFILLLNLPAQGQSFHAEINYRSFKPYINFQLEIGNRYRSPDVFESAYLKGYMDGVNRSYYNGYRFYELVHNIRAYELGYEDGLRDRRLLRRLRGPRYGAHSYFSYDDYYSPYYSVQIWLSELSFTFLSAPERRLPRHWTKRIHPRVKKYRNRFKQKRYFSRYKRHHRSEMKRLKKHSQRNRKRYQKNRRSKPQQYSRQRLNKNRAAERVRSRAKSSPSVKNRSSRTRERVRSRNRGSVKKENRSSTRVKNRPRSGNRKKVRSRSRSRSDNDRSKVKKRGSRKSKSRSRGGGKKRSRGGN